MKIFCNYFSSCAAPCFRERISISLTAQQKKILVIVAFAFAFLAFCYALRRCFVKAKSVKTNEPIDKTSQIRPVPFQSVELKHPFDKSRRHLYQRKQNRKKIRIKILH